MKNQISVLLHLSRVMDNIYVGIDAKPSDLKEFGITMEMYQELGNEIQKIFTRILVQK